MANVMAKVMVKVASILMGKFTDKLMRNLVLYCLVLAISLNQILPSVTYGEEFGSRPSSIPLEQQIDNAIFWYSQAKNIQKEDVPENVRTFLVAFLTHLEVDTVKEASLEAQRASQERHKTTLKLYDGLIANSGPTESHRQNEMLALAAALQDETSAEDDKKRALLLEKYKNVTAAHYAAMAEAEAQKQAAGKPPGFKVNWEEVLKTIGVYSLYGLCMISATYAIKTELHAYPFFSKFILLQIAIFSVAAGPFGFFLQLYNHVWAKTKTKITDWSQSRAKRKLHPITQCSKLF